MEYSNPFIASLDKQTIGYSLSRQTTTLRYSQSQIIIAFTRRDMNESLTGFAKTCLLLFMIAISITDASAFATLAPRNEAGFATPKHLAKPAVAIGVAQSPPPLHLLHTENVNLNGSPPQELNITAWDDGQNLGCGFNERRNALPYSMLICVYS